MKPYRVCLPGLCRSWHNFEETITGLEAWGMR